MGNYFLTWERYGIPVAGLILILFFLTSVPVSGIVIPPLVYYGIPVLFFLLTSIITWKKMGTTVLSITPDFWYREPAFLLGRRTLHGKNTPKNFDNYFIVYRVWFYLLLAVFVLGVMGNWTVVALILLHFLVKRVF